MKAQGIAYRNLGRTGLKVSQICLGTAFRGQADENTCIRVIDRAIDLGCNFIDTALYGGGQSETFVGKALKDKRDDIVSAPRSSVPLVIAQTTLACLV